MGLIGAKGFETRRFLKHEGTKTQRHEGINKLDGVKNRNLLLFLLKKVIFRILFLKKSNKNDRK